MANTYLGVSTTSSGTRTKWTISFWVKRSNLSNENTIFAAYLDNDNKDKISFNTDGTLQFASFQAGSYSNGGNLITERVFRDVNAWYHIVCRWDSSNATANNRMKIWVNGEEMSDFSSRTNPSSGRESLINYQQITVIGRMASNYLDGCLSHVHFCDNQLYQASDFGETDATTGEWKIKTDVSVSYGTTGYFALKDGNSLTDQSSNSNNLTLQGGTLTKTEDCPSNVFATMNPLHLSLNTDRSFANGNTYVVLGGTARVPEVSTLGMTSGKFYAEAKVTGGSGGNSIFGITGEIHRFNATDYLGTDAYDYGYYSDDGTKANGANETSYGDSWTDGDIIGIAVDLDNLKIYFSKNGVWQNSGDPTSGATGTGAAFTLSSPSSTNDGAYFFACGDDNQYAARRMAWNFGNGYFQTTAVASAGTNASGNGIFEYDVPTGYTALSTKGLNL